MTLTPFSQFVPALPHDNRRVELTRAEFADLDLWTLPRNLTVHLSDAPVFGSLVLKRTTQAFRVDWRFDPDRAEAIPNYPNILIADALHLAALRTKGYAIHTTVLHAKEFVSFWVPLSRHPEAILNPIVLELNRIWETAFAFAQALPDVLRRFEVAHPPT